MSSIITYRKRAFTKKIIIHDSHTEPEQGGYEDVTRWAMQAKLGGLRMGLLSTGYHYIIERDGERVVARDRESIGSHTPGKNLESIGICLVGGREFDTHEGVDNFTRDQRRAILRLIEELMAKYKDIGIEDIVGHSEVQKYRNRQLPKCPPMDMNMFREDVKLYVEEGIFL